MESGELGNSDSKHILRDDYDATSDMQMTPPLWQKVKRN